MCKKYKFEGKIELQKNEKQLSTNGTIKTINEREKFNPKTYWVLFLGIHILLIICAIIFSDISINFAEESFSITTCHSLLLLVIICIIIIVFSTIIYFSIKKNNKLCLINKILEDENLMQISDTTTKYDKDGNITEITSSDQKTKVLIAAIEAIKDL